MALAETLLSLLQKYGLSQRKLAEKAGVNYVTINRLLNDYQFNVTGDTIDKLARGIGCTEEERDALHQAAGSLPDDIRTKFSESEPATKLFRRISRMDTEAIEDLLKELEAKDTRQEK